MMRCRRGASAPAGAFVLQIVGSPPVDRCWIGLSARVRIDSGVHALVVRAQWTGV
jgi:hypothetical protein